MFLIMQQAGMNRMKKVLDQQTVEVTLPNQVGFERVAMDCSASLARLIGIVRERVDDLKTAVAEACLNAIEHGNKGRPNARVVVTINYSRDDFIVAVTDEGSGIQDQIIEPDIERQILELDPPGGIGIF
jgi:serine/threonine-protein kinase RsbW